MKSPLPSGNTINDIHDHPDTEQLGVKVRSNWFSCSLKQIWMVTRYM